MSGQLPSIRVALNLDATTLYVQQVLSDRMDEIKASMMTELERQFKELDLDQIIRNELDGVVVKVIKEDVRNVFLDVWYRRDEDTPRKQIRKALADALAKEMLRLGVDS